MNKEEFIEFASQYNLIKNYDYEFKNNINEVTDYSFKKKRIYDIILEYEIIEYINKSKYIIYLTNIGVNFICVESTLERNILKRELKIQKLL